MILTYQLRLYCALLSVLVGSVFAGLMMHQANTTVCRLVEIRLSAAVGPLGRELTLGEFKIAQSLFEGIRSDLRSLGAYEDLQLQISSPSTNETETSTFNCRPRLFASQIHYPIVFGGQTGATIQGKVGYFPVSGFISGLGVIFVAFCLAFREVVKQERRNLEMKNAENLGQLATQVAHDIRSPLAALESVLKRMDLLPEDERTLLQEVAARIKHIANHLLDSNRSKLGPVLHRQPLKKASRATHPLVSSLVDSLINEKKARFHTSENLTFEAIFEDSSTNIYTDVPPQDFKTILSNLIDNAIEAMDFAGLVRIRVKVSDREIQISIEDNGKGIPPEILPRLTQRGFSFGKRKGSGLGLYSARTQIESWGGSLAIHSQLGVGTTVRISLPT